MNSYDKYLLKIFSNKNIYKVGNELNNMLQKEFGITASNSRKIISRACNKNIIGSSKPVTFGNGQYVYFNKKSGLDTHIVKKITKQNRPPIYHLLNLLDTNNGIISYYEGLKITASPIKKEKEKSNTLDEILDMLMILNIVNIEKANGITYIVLTNHKQNTISLMLEHQSNMVLDCMFIPDIRNWLVKHNFIDNKYVVYRSKTLLTKGAEHNNYIWDAYAYTNTTGYNTILGNNKERDEKKTLVVLDIVIYRTYISSDVQGFLRRIQAIRSSAKIERKVLPIVIYQEITPHAYKQLQALGFIMLDLSSIYSNKIYPIIQSVKSIKGAIIHDYVENNNIANNVDNTLSKIDSSGQTENLGNMKGDLFEALMYPVIKLLHPDASIEQGKILRRKNPDGKEEYYEYDIIIRDYQNQEIVVYEFKGYDSSKIIQLKPFDKKNTVKWFFNNTLKFAREELKKETHFPVKGCYITTAKFSEEALKVLNNLNTHKNTKPETHDIYYDGEKLINLLKQKKQSRIVQVLEKHFIKSKNNETAFDTDDIVNAKIQNLDSIHDLNDLF